MEDYTHYEMEQLATLAKNVARVQSQLNACSINDKIMFDRLSAHLKHDQDTLDTKVKAMATNSFWKLKYEDNIKKLTDFVTSVQNWEFLIIQKEQSIESFRKQAKQDLECFYKELA